MAKQNGRNYLYLILGALFLVALAIVLSYSAGPLSGCVGVVRIDGPIVSRDIAPTLFSDEVKGSETIAEDIASADSQDDIKSVLVLIDSPGGSVVASREIYDALHALNKSSVSYINEIGASGGYYAAAGTDYIVANPDAITGSIGARATFSDLSGLFAKLGYNETVVKSGAMKDIGSPSRPMTPEEFAVVESIINESFSEFKRAVLESRGSRLDRKAFETVLDARILSGRQAKKIGLVDQNGNQKSAVRKAAELGGIAGEPRLCELSSSSGRRSIFGSFSAQLLEIVSQNMQAPKLSYS